MTPPQPPTKGDTPRDGAPAAVPFCAPPPTLKQRRDFQRANRGRRVVMPGFILQARQRPDDAATGTRVGYTCSKKVGNAVARNRAKRRLREAVRLTLPALAHADHDYVLIGRPTVTATLPFDNLCTDLAKALVILHGKPT